jgi:hypothetical protein
MIIISINKCKEIIKNILKEIEDSHLLVLFRKQIMSKINLNLKVKISHLTTETLLSKMDNFNQALRIKNKKIELKPLILRKGENPH